MALKGQVEQYGVADAWQLLLQQDSTGVLRVESKNTCVEVGFDKSFVVGVRCTVGGVVQNPSQQALVLCGKDPSPEEVWCVVREHVGDMLAWKEGVYVFHPAETAPVLSSTPRMRGDVVLMEAMHKQYVWPSYAGTYSLDPAVLYTLKTPEKDVLAWLHEGLSKTPVSDEAWDDGAEKKTLYAHAEAVAHLLSGSSCSVPVLAMRAQTWVFEVCMALDLLVKQGYAGVLGGGEAKGWSQVLWGR